MTSKLLFWLRILKFVTMWLLDWRRSGQKERITKQALWIRKTFEARSSERHQGESWQETFAIGRIAATQRGLIPDTDAHQPELTLEEQVSAYLRRLARHPRRYRQAGHWVGGKIIATVISQQSQYVLIDRWGPDANNWSLLWRAGRGRVWHHASSFGIAWACHERQSSSGGHLLVASNG